MTVVQDPPSEPIDYEAIKERREKYLKELDQVYEKWMGWPEGKEMLEGFSEHKAKAIAMILENQRLWNESYTANDQFTKISIKMVYDILKDFIGFEVVNVWPMIGPMDNSFAYRFKYEAPKEGEDDLPNIHLKLVDEPITAKTRKMKAAYPCLEDPKPSLEDVAKEIRDEMVREIFTDLRNNVGTIMTKKVNLEKLDFETVYINVVEMSGVIHRKTLRGGCNWLLMGVEMAKKLPKYVIEAVDFDSIKSPTKIGVLNSKWKIFVDPLYINNDILVGYHEAKELLPSYFYQPYVMLAPTPVILDPGDFCPRRGFLSRYGKRLYREGAKFFGRIKYEQEEPKPADYNI
jgi:hypothetical protein